MGAVKSGDRDLPSVAVSGDLDDLLASLIDQVRCFVGGVVGDLSSCFNFFFQACLIDYIVAFVGCAAVGIVCKFLVRTHSCVRSYLSFTCFGSGLLPLSLRAMRPAGLLQQAFSPLG